MPRDKSPRSRVLAPYASPPGGGRFSFVLVLSLAFSTGPRIASAASSCINITSEVNHAGDRGPVVGESCQPYSVNITAVAETKSDLSPVMDVAVIVDESGSVPILCDGSGQCYQDEKNFAMEIMTLLDASVNMFSRGGTALYLEYSGQVNTNSAFTSLQDYLDGESRRRCIYEVYTSRCTRYIGCEELSRYLVPVY